MGLSGAVLWWEQWQLRILVLASLFVQWLLFLSASFRKYAIPSWFRSIIWLAYLGSDALAIYALATLFSRQSRQDCNSGQGNSILEVVWAPVLLMHLGGQDLITAYNIEDNELWTRHIVTAVSQITVAIYVFCKSWPGGDKRLLQAAILLFVPGVLKCIEKPWALMSASINNLVSPSSPAPVRTANREGGINSLEDYVQAARAFIQVNPRCQAQELDADGSCLPDQAQGEGDAVDLEAADQTQGEEDVVELEADKLLPDQVKGEDDVVDHEPNLQPQTSTTWRSRLVNQIKGIIRRLINQDSGSQVEDYNVYIEAYKLFVDLASPYPDRLGILKSFWILDEKQAYVLLQDRLFNAFDLLYTKEKMISAFQEKRKDPSLLELVSGYIRLSALLLPLVAIFLFHKSHREAYNDNDVKVTYALFCCTTVLELACLAAMASKVSREANSLNGISGVIIEWAKAKIMEWKWVKKMVALLEWTKTKVTQWQQAIVFQFQDATSTAILEHSFVGQYTLIGFFVRNKTHTMTNYVLRFCNCKYFFDRYWSMKPCNSSFPITELVLKYVKEGWEDQIKDADSYCKFSNRRGQWTLQAQKCNYDLGCILRRPFDESVVLWHIVTDFCFYYMDTSVDQRCATAQCFQDASGEGHGCAVWCEKSPHHERAVQCREMSNYMMYLLFVNPEMLLAGTRRNLFLTANAEVEEILEDDRLSVEKIVKAKKPWLKDILMGEKQWLKDILEKKDSHPWMILKGLREEILKAEKKWLQEIERGLVGRIISKVQRTASPPDADATIQEGFVPDAWNIANALLQIGDQSKMWGVIEGVWVEMLCFSASRCRGYLHAKSMGSGLELLTYVWFLLSCMGMDTLPERLQRTELSSGGGNPGANPCTSQISRSERPTRSWHSRPEEEAAAAGASTSQPQEILPAE